MRDANPERVGRFVAAGKGIHYVTATRSGDTDAAGTFRYLPGETVTFSVGPIVLGATPGAAQISPFTLASMTAPTTEFALRHELDRASRGPTPFTRAMNIEMLLMTLDADHDPANGLDATANVAGIPADGIDLGLALAEFSARVQYLGPGVTRAIPTARPLVELYRALNIVVPAHGKLTDDLTIAGGRIRRIEIKTFAADGSRLSDGVDADNDGVPESLTTYTYGPLGRLAKVDIHLPGREPPAVAHSDISFDYDTAGNLTGSLEHDSPGDDAGDIVSHRHVVRDARGRITSDILESDTDGDGLTDHRFAHSYEWDAHDNQVRDTQLADAGEGTAPQSRTVVISTFDANNRLLTDSTESDDDADGTVDRRTTNTREYGAGPRPTRVANETMQSGGAAVSSRFTATSVYDGDGNELSKVAEDDFNADGVIDSRQIFETVYDAEHRNLVQRVRLDDGPNDEHEYSSTTTRTYDGAGNVLTEATQVDVDGDGAIDASSTKLCEYGAGGELLRCEATSLLNGVVDPASSSSTVATQTAFTDGVRALAQEYIGLVN